MIVLDENFPDAQRQVLRGWGIRVQQVGHELGHAGMADEEVRSLLHGLHEPTLFTRDLGFYARRYCHVAYCIVVLEVSRAQAASFVRRTLRHPSLDTWARRRGRVARVSSRAIHLWRLHEETETSIDWPHV